MRGGGGGGAFRVSADGREGANELEEGDVAGQPDVFTRPEVLRDFSSGGYYA